MFQIVEVPLWLLVLILLFATVTFASHFLFPSVRWFFRRRLESAVVKLNKRLDRPIEPFKLARRHDMIQRLVYDPKVIKAVAEHASEQSIPENVAFQEARKYAREIVPSFSASAYFGIATRLANLLSNALYDVRISQRNENRIKFLDPDATIVFVINHRSNMDYVLTTYLAAERSALSYAVGEWARVWPLSALIKAMGAYFIRRRSRNELYRCVLARYVGLATDGGVTQAMFPEGSLSLDGSVKPPKLGLLKYIIEGFHAGQKEVIFIPVALNYDRVLEDRVLTSANESAKNGGKPRFQARISVVASFAVKQIWLRMRGRYKKFGSAGVCYGEALVLSEFLQGKDGDLPKVLGFELMRRIKKAVPLLPVPVVAYVLQAHEGQDRPVLEQHVSQLLERLKAQGGEQLFENATGVVDAGLRQLCERKIVLDDGNCISVPKAQRSILDYYANSIRHLVEPDAT